MPHRIKHAVEAEAVRDALLELGELLLVAAHEVQHVLRGAHRALDAAQRIPLEQLLDALDRNQDLVGGGGETLAQGGRLRRHVVGAAGHDQGLVLAGAVAHGFEQRDRLVAGELEGAAHLQLLHVFGQVARGHALVDFLVPRQRVELLDASLHVVAGNFFTRRNRVQVHLVDDFLVVLDRARFHGHTELLLRLQHGDPELPLQDDLVLRRPQGGHLRGGVTVTQDIRIIRLHGLHHREIAPSIAGRAMSLR